ncbi:heptaprenyl diphosphate synthase component 1 [Paenibacillus sp. NFR01]|uniref:heptaprenyl diphosphate synthase component 1 n=1 Tax=Paenibacillus sp. NFR01 TaxID=1566279 RepID=UPI0008BC590D|nr:heptaprenyl diphosphate synthase component 1 [Paenibacillus sp. NFR01]SET52805.1 heptaprenyl diphosphate synthase [Paenibacillus sp. NFR01]
MKPYRIPQLATSYTGYDMIQRHTELPPLSAGRGHLLYTFLSHGQAHTVNHGELYTLATALVQLGLDTHESIERSGGDPDGEAMRSRQLKVLAGDYFSSWFYHLLAKQEQIEMIGVLSAAIADVNVMKARLYGKMRDMLLSAEQYLRYTVQLNMRLFLSFIPMIPEPLAGLYERLLAEFSQVEAVNQELQRAEDPAGAREGFCYWMVLETGSEEEQAQLRSGELAAKEWKMLKLKYKCDSLLRDKLHGSLKSIQGLLAGIKDEALSAELGGVFDRLYQQVKISGLAAMEG